jgi:integrase
LTFWVFFTVIFCQSFWLEWADINYERKQIAIKSSKNGKSRTIPVSKKLIDLLQSLPKIENQKMYFLKEHETADGQVSGKNDEPSHDT